MTTHSRFLPFSFPDVSDDPFANVYYEVDLSKWPTRFEKTPDDGLKIRLFSDLKRHYMGQELMEDFQGATSQQNGEFITVKLWGVADSAPYLHDGRAQTIGTAIKLHGGEAQTARDNFVALSADDKNAVLKYLRTLRTPSQPNRDVVPNVSSRLGGPLDHLSRGARRRHGQ